MANTYRLKGHESFYLREGWLTKGLRAVHEDPRVFFTNGGADALGVGTNMAKSIRYWLKTAGLIKDSAKSGAELTKIGQIIFDNDLYIEDIFTLWIIHINIVLNYAAATSWAVFFNEFDLSSFKRDEMNDLMKRLLIETTGDIKLPDRSIRDDCTAIVSMYSNSREENADPEDKKVSPFANLGLLKQNGQLFSKEQPLQSLVDPLIILYIIRDRLIEEKTLSIDEIRANSYSFKNEVMTNIDTAIMDCIKRRYSNTDITGCLNELLSNRHVAPKKHNQEFCITRYFNYAFMSPISFANMRSIEYLHWKNRPDGVIILITPEESVINLLKQILVSLILS